MRYQYETSKNSVRYQYEIREGSVQHRCSACFMLKNAFNSWKQTAPTMDARQRSFFVNEFRLVQVRERFPFVQTKQRHRWTRANVVFSWTTSVYSSVANVSHVLKANITNVGRAPTLCFRERFPFYSNFTNAFRVFKTSENAGGWDFDLFRFYFGAGLIFSNI